MQEKNPEIAQFTDKYEHTNFITVKLMDRFFQTVISLCPLDAKELFEAGCGPGYSTRVLFRSLKPEKMYASDIDPRLVEMAKEKVPETIASVESAYDFKRGDDSVDLAFMLEVLEHLEDPEKALQEVKRVTRKYAIFSVPREPIWRISNMARGAYLKDLGNTPGHINHWSARSFAKFVGKHFEVVKVKTSFPWTIVLAKKR